MPPFVLEYKAYKPKERITNILYHKKEYSTGVKLPGWQNFQNSQPVDNNPYARDAYSLHNSHYNRLGTCPEEKWISTTQAAWEETHDRRSELEAINPNKTIVNLHTTIGCSDNDPRYKRHICSSIYGSDYLTTMQHSYQPPYPYLIKRLAMPELPFFLNRRIKTGSECKFQDDDYVYQLKRLQKYKGHRYVSFNPCTGCYSDGVVTTIQGPKCVNLKY